MYCNKVRNGRKEADRVGLGRLGWKFIQINLNSCALCAL